MAEGVVNPIQAAKAPENPPRINPILNPTWLDDGPGKNWQSAISSENKLGFSHFLLCTSSRLKKPRCAIGPPKDDKPKDKKVLKISNFVKFGSTRFFGISIQFLVDFKNKS